MTARHLVNGLMRHLNCHSHRECERKIGLTGGTLSRMYNRNADIRVVSLDRMQNRTGLSFDQLMAWYRQEETNSRASAL